MIFCCFRKSLQALLLFYLALGVVYHVPASALERNFPSVLFLYLFFSLYQSCSLLYVLCVLSVRLCLTSRGSRMGEDFSSDLETYHRAHTKISYQELVVSSFRGSTVAGVAPVRIAIVVSFSRRLFKIDNPWFVFHPSLSPSNIKHPRTRER